MSGLPTGTVTFLFADIEGSTRLWEDHRGAMEGALSRHDAILHAAISGHCGSVIGTGGDAFLAAFARAPDALCAALDAQRHLWAEEWDPACVLRVRMALHTGIAEERDGNYYGPTLNRAARLLSAGHGGQILVSSSTQELLRDTLPSDAMLRDMGEHRLKDLASREHVFQIVVPDLAADFPALKTLDARPTNLPQQLTAFIGREREVPAVADMVRRDEVRLLTLLGPAGTGKTRLALRVGAELRGDFRDGVFFVSLAPIRDPAFLASAVAEALGVQETGNRSMLDVVKEFLRDKQMVLVLDNFEQIVEGAGVVADILRACPGIRAIVTSREVLRVSGEHTFAVPPLEVPNTENLPRIEILLRHDAVALFVERAQAVKADFSLGEQNASAVAKICARLDGLPLAIELAATRIRLFTPQALLGRLSNRLQILVGGGRELPDRQQTLRGTIDWSYDLLAPVEQTLFARLSVFSGGCGLEAAEVVCRDDVGSQLDILDGIASLVEKSLLRQTEGTEGEPRFTMLETIREYGLERLAQAKDLDRVRRAHALYVLELVELAEPKLFGPEQVSWLNRLEDELDNIRAALEWAKECRETEVGLRVAGSLWRFWRARGHVNEGRRWLDAFVDRARAEGIPDSTGSGLHDYTQALLWAASLAIDQGEYDSAQSDAEEALESQQRICDKGGIALALNVLGILAHYRSEHSRAATLYGEGLAHFREIESDWGIALSLNNLGALEIERGNSERAASYYEESLAIERERGDSWKVALLLNNLGDVAAEAGSHDEAQILNGEALRLHRELGYAAGIAESLTCLANAAAAQGGLQKAVNKYQESFSLHQRLGDKWGLTVCMEGLAAIAGRTGRCQSAARLYAAASALRDVIGHPISPKDRRGYDEGLNVLRSALGADAFEDAWNSGRLMPSGEAIKVNVLN
ncbi:MAG: ATP-binding protein [Chloroflexota bacterium]